MSAQNVGIQHDSTDFELSPLALNDDGLTIIVMETEEDVTESHSPATMSNWSGYRMLPVYGGVFLALIVIVLGFTANHGNSWKIMFVV